MIFNPTRGQAGGGGVPKGIVCAWSGTQSDIPDGWALCDGNNGTPDLRGRFVLGAGGGYDVNAKGGEENHVLTVEEMPSHKHNVKSIIRSGGSGSTVHSVDSTGSRTEITESAGGNAAHNNMPPYWALCYIMKS